MTGLIYNTHSQIWRRYIEYMLAQSVDSGIAQDGQRDSTHPGCMILSDALRYYWSISTPETLMCLSGFCGSPAGILKRSGSYSSEPLPPTSWNTFRLSLSLWMTLQPSQRANTDPVAQTCGLTSLVLTVPQRLHVYWTCSPGTRQA